METSIVNKLAEVQARYDALANRLGDPGLINNQREFQKAAREHSRLTPLMDRFQEYQRVAQELRDVRDMLSGESDPDLQRMAKDEEDRLVAEEERLRQGIRILMLPRDPNDDRNVIMEIRAGAGGEESALFAGSLLHMYSKYAERQGWRVEVLDANPTDLGGFKEVILEIKGTGAFSQLKFESGVHRVQRVPDTEAQGRIHTSTVTVAVLPEAEDIDVQINPGDLKIERMRSAGAGGQHVNKTESAIRLTHLATGISVHCQDERSQGQNMERAMSILRSRLFELVQGEAHAAEAAARRAQVGTGDRSERVRTYNFPENRLSDHRIKLTLYRLAMILEGDLEEVIQALQQSDQAEKLRSAEAAV